MKIIVTTLALWLCGSVPADGTSKKKEQRVELQKILGTQQRFDLTRDLANARKGVRDPKVSYEKHRQWIWNILVFRNYPDPPILFRDLGTTRSEIRRLLEEKRRLMPMEHRRLRDWRDTEIDAYLRSVDFAQ